MRLRDQSIALDSFPKEMKLMLSILGAEEVSDLQSRIVDNGVGVDWGHFIQLIQYHRIYPVIYTKINKLERNEIPANVTKIIQRQYINNTLQMLSLCGEIQVISKIFMNYNLRWLMLKGPVLAEALYGDISLRTSKDLDVLISLTDLELVKKLLEELGYNIVAPSKSSEKKEHHWSFFHPTKGIEIEIHWKLNRQTWNEPGFDDMWERRVAYNFKGIDMFILSPEDLFLNLVTHGARHGWFRLRWLYDIDRLIRQDQNWDRIIEHMEKYELIHIGSAALVLVSWLFQSPVQDIVIRINSNRRAFRIARLNIRFLQGSNKHWYMLSLINHSDMRSYLFHLFRPKQWDMDALPLPKAFAFLYYPLRPALYLWRLLKGKGSEIT